MLSRVAESLYWTARSIERAENTSRLVDVTFHGLLDARVSDPEQAWRDLLRAVGRDDLFGEHFTEYTPRAVTEFLLWHPDNPDSVTACVARARENLRGVREQISSEMWEHLNRLHLLVARARPARVLEAPHEFLVRVREGSHAFQGVTKLTLSRGEAYAFLSLGAHLERADTTARVLLTSVPTLVDGSVDRLSSLLRSCGAFEAFRRHESEEVQGERVADFLLLDRSFPRSVLFCAERCLEAIRFVSGNSQQPERSLGMLVARLAFADVPQLEPPSLAALLGEVRHGPPRRRQRARRRVLRDAGPASRPLRPATAATAGEPRMLIRVEHATTFTYAERITEAYTELRVRPLSSGGQHCTSFRLVTDPPGIRVRAYLDRLGNHVQHLEVLEDHDRISITAISEVTHGRGVLRLRARLVAARAPRLPRADGVRAVRGRRCSSSRRPRQGEGTETERATEVMRALRSLLVYERGATDVMTRADAALALGRGVCQDFAHVMLAACRRAGIPSRYVSGYLYDPQETRGREPRVGGRARRAARLGLDRPDARPRADRGVRSRRRRSRLRRRAADARRLQGHFGGDARGRGADGRPVTRLGPPLGSELDGWRVEEYGRSRDGVPLRVFLPAGDGPVAGLLTAAQHGEEADTALLVRRLLERVPAAETRWAVIPVLNPDGLLAGTRQNAAGVDLNRNFPASTWEPGETFTFPPGIDPEVRILVEPDEPLLAGAHAGSEPETQALTALIERLEPPLVVDLHSPLELIFVRGAVPPERDRGARPLGGHACAGGVRGPLPRRLRRLAVRARHARARLRDRARRPARALQAAPARARGPAPELGRRQRTDAAAPPRPQVLDARDRGALARRQHALGTAPRRCRRSGRRRRSRGRRRR